MGQASPEWRETKLNEQFYRWELRGRGWQVYDTPVSSEPPFRPFTGHWLPSVPPVRDGRQQTLLSSFVNGLRQRLSPDPPPELPADSPKEEEPEPDRMVRTGLVELAISLPPNHPVPRELFEQFLFNLSLCREPFAFELVATGDAITPQFAVHPADALLIRPQLAAYFPEAVVTPQERMLEGVWREATETAVVEFGLANEFMLPLATGKLDAFVGLASSLAGLGSGEVGVFQVLFQPVSHPWAESILRAVTDGEGGSFFVNRPELLAAAKQKISRPLYAAVLRLAAGSGDASRAWAIVQNMAGPLAGLSHLDGNELIPLHNDDYPLPDHDEDVWLRQSRRSGMLLNSDELLALVHLPSASVRTAKLVRENSRTKLAPKSVGNHEGWLLGQNFHAGQTTQVRLNAEQRVRHTHIIGATGTGKSTLLSNLIRQDIENGQGLAVLDPHGDLIEAVLRMIPPDRVHDVILFDPSDEEYSVGFNILTAHSDLEKTLLASDLVSVFQRLSTSWGDQMSSVLHNAILAFLESSKGGTLSDLRRFLLDAGYRNEFLKTVNDPEVVYYWQQGFPQLSGNKSIGPVLTRLETFLSPKPIRFMVSQPANRLDFANIMDTGKIFLGKLPQGLIGRENAYLLGSLLMSKFQQSAMSRQRLETARRNCFWIYLDEFHHFITPSMAEILTGARKYRVGLILAHHELRQLQRDADVASAVLAHCFTRVVLRVGDADARTLAEGFSAFEARDLQNLEMGEAVCRVERSDFDFNLFVPFPDSNANATTSRDAIIAASRAKYATPRTEVEAELQRHFQPVSPEAKNQLHKVQKTAHAVAETPEPIQPVALFPQDSETESAPPYVAPPLPPEMEPEVRPKTAKEKLLGKGGPQHIYLQRFITQWAQGMGYLAKTEFSVPGGLVDVALEKKKVRKIACEISMTSDVQQEISNIKKCLAADFDFVALVVPDEKRLPRLREGIGAVLSEAEAAKVRFVTPDGLFAFVEDLGALDASHSETVRGCRVKVNHRVVDTATKAERQKMLAKILADSVKRPKA